MVSLGTPGSSEFFGFIDKQRNCPSTLHAEAATLDEYSPAIAYNSNRICNWTSSQRRPVVAYGRTPEELLVTWVNAPSGQPTYISARRIFADGRGFPGDPFLVSSKPEDCDFASVAYNRARNEYPVTWGVLKSGSGLDIYGVRLSATGTALTGGNPPVNGEFPISDTTLPQQQVDVSCDATGRKSLLAWQDKNVGGEYGIWARQAYSDENLGLDFEVAGSRSAADRQFRPWPVGASAS